MLEFKPACQRVVLLTEVAETTVIPKNLWSVSCWPNEIEPWLLLNVSEWVSRFLTAPSSHTLFVEPRYRPRSECPLELIWITKNFCRAISIWKYISCIVMLIAPVASHWGCTKIMNWQSQTANSVHSIPAMRTDLKGSEHCYKRNPDDPTLLMTLHIA